jgi:hypothetical protein
VRRIAAAFIAFTLVLGAVVGFFLIFARVLRAVQKLRPRRRARKLTRPVAPRRFDSRRFVAAALIGAFFVASSPSTANSEDESAVSAVAVPAPAPSASPDPRGPAPTVYGDLSHLSFTATRDLHAFLLEPKSDSASETSATSIEVAVGLGQGADVRVNGELIPPGRLGKRVIDPPAGVTRYTFYGIALLAGPNRLEITPLGAGNLRGTTITSTIYGPGKPATIEAAFEGRAVADGRSPLVLRVTASDEWQHAAAPGSIVKVRIVSGDARLVRTSTPNADAKKTQDLAAAIASAGAAPATFELVLGPGGTASATFGPGLKPGDLTVHLACDELELDRRIFLAPDARVPLVVGLASIGIGAVPAAAGETAQSANGADSRRGRIALFASGSLNKTMLATLAYDTADTLTRDGDHGAFIDDAAARPYQTYGDASARRQDALSRDHLYARVDSGRSSVMWGEFQAQTGSDDGIGGFNLLVDGAKVELAQKNTKLSAFTARNDVAYSRQVFNPSGLATLGNPLHSGIVVGSDVVTLIALDRRTGIPVSQTTLTRNIDYTLDYPTGQLTFIEPPLPFDTNFNPQQILVQYEYSGPGTVAQTTGGRFEGTLGPNNRMHFGIGYVNDAYGAGNISLLGEDVGGQLSGGSWSVSHLASRGILATQALGTSVFGTSGDAYRASFRQARGPDHLAFSFESTTAGYDNPFGGLSTPGLLDYRAEYGRKFGGQRGELTFSFDHEQNAGLGALTSQSNAAVHLQENIGKRFKLTAGLIRSVQSTGTFQPIVPGQAAAPNGVAAAAGTPSDAGGSTTQADLGLEWKPANNLAFSLHRLSDIGPSTDTAQPAETSAQLSLNLPGKGRAYIRELWSAAPISSFAAATQGLTNPVLSTRATSFGIERPFGNATVTTDYAIQQTANGTDVSSSMGVTERFELSKLLRGDASFQRGGDTGASSGAFNVYGLNLAYADKNGRLRANGAYQLRTGDGGGSTLRFGAAGALSPAFALFGTADAGHVNGISSGDAKIGLAFRPVNNDRSVMLFDYERTDDGSSTAPLISDILSLEQLYRPTTRLEIAGRFAYKLDGDVYYPAHSQLVSLRAVQRIGSHFDVGAEGSVLGVRGIAGASTSAFAFETGYRLGDQIRLAVGYNLSGAPDPALAAAPSRRGIYFTMTSLIDRIFGWGK